MGNGIEPSILQEFVQECLTFIDEARDRIGVDGCGPDGVQGVFRSLHTLKGSSGFLELVELSNFIHRFEDFVRDRQQQGAGLSAEEGRAVLEGLDLLQEAVGRAEERALPASAVYTDYLASLGRLRTAKASIVRLDALLEELRKEFSVAQAGDSPFLLPVVEAVEVALAKMRSTREHTVLPVDPGRLEKVLLAGEDITDRIKRQFAAMERVALEGRDAFRMLRREELDGELRSLGRLLDGERILVTWDMIEDLCTISPEVVDVACKRLWTEGIALQGAITLARDAGGERGGPTDSTAAGGRQSTPDQSATAAPEFFRVSEKVIEEILHGVGKLVADRNALDNLVQAVGLLIPVQFRRHLNDICGELDRHVNYLEERVNRLGSRKLQDAFQRLPALAFQLGRELDKEVMVEVAGGDIEIPRSLIKSLNDPLLHILRNSVDHGLERAEARLAAGKAGTGLVRVCAARDEDTLKLVVEDDGRGLDIAKIRAKAEERGLLRPGETPDDQQVADLIFASGFSTSPLLTKVSGRGVGMDVVKNAVEGRGGRVRVESSAGQGTRFHIVLPLDEGARTRDVQLIEADGAVYGVECRFLVEVLDRDAVTLHSYREGTFFPYREELLPFVHLADCLAGRADEEGAGDPGHGCGRVLIVQDEQDRRLAFGIRGIRHKVKVVVTPFSHRFLKENPFFCGTAVIGAGEPCLVLDCRDLGLFRSVDRVGRA